MNRRELVLVLAILLAGAGMVLLAGGQPWSEVADPTVSVSPSITAPLEGQAVAPVARALGYVALAGVVALLATRRIGRTLVGVLLVFAGVGIGLASLFWTAEAPVLTGDAAEPLDRTFWPWVSLAGGGLVLLAGIGAAVRGRRWSAMGSAYDSPAGRPERTSDDAWAALDRGEDPTA